MNAYTDDDFNPFSGCDDEPCDMLDKEILQEHSKLTRDLRRENFTLQPIAAQIKAWAMMINNCV